MRKYVTAGASLGVLLGAISGLLIFDVGFDGFGGLWPLTAVLLIVICPVSLAIGVVVGALLGLAYSLIFHGTG
jgi:hypothetical protein